MKLSFISLATFNTPLTNILTSLLLWSTTKSRVFTVFCCILHDILSLIAPSVYFHITSSRLTIIPS
nr:MAG TPA: hypothetical protein [Caudoviricetes sp.]